jgi:lambda repressor-like predicted transcriptional regulator
VDAVEAWDVTTGDGIKVAVLDTGVATDNEDIAANVVLHANFSTAATGQDNYGHGTHVAGIIAAIKDTEGVSGVCPDCSILDGKVLNDDGSGSTSAIANGINWAVANGAKVINMSLGQRVSSRALEAAVNNAWNKGVVIVAAAGNAGTQAPIYPGAYPNVIAVAATDNNDAKSLLLNLRQVGGCGSARGQCLLDLPETPLRSRYTERPRDGLRHHQRHLNGLTCRRRRCRPCVEHSCRHRKHRSPGKSRIQR